VVVVVVVGLERRWFQNLNPLHPVACLHLLSKGAAGRQAYLSGFDVFISGNRWQAGARQLFFHCPLISNRERERERERDTDLNLKLCT
jgi:hypothetical protein